MSRHSLFVAAHASIVFSIFAAAISLRGTDGAARPGAARPGWAKTIRVCSGASAALRQQWLALYDGANERPKHGQATVGIASLSTGGAQ